MSTAAREDPKAKAEAEAEAEAEADDHNEYAEYAARLKDQGNEAFKAGDIALSITFYTQAIDMDPDNHVYYSNRSAAYMKADSKSKALWDGAKCVELAPTWSKGYNRLGTAQHALGRFDDAIDTFKKGIELDTDNQALWTALAKAQDSQAVDKKRRFAEAARERAIEEEALRQKDLAKKNAKIAEENRKKESEKKEVDNFLSEISQAGNVATPPAVVDPVAEVVKGHSDNAANTSATADVSEPKEESGDLLAGFFSELSDVSKEKQRQQEEKSLQARDLLLTQKYTNQDLGTGKEQYERLTQPNYVWKNQNPYVVMQLGIDATEEDVKYRYRKLSTKIHPDKLRDVEEPRLAFEELKNAYHKLMDEKQRNVVIMNIEFVEKETRKERKRLFNKGVDESTLLPLEEEIAKATVKHFADMYLHRQKSEQHLHAHNARERKTEEDEKVKAEKFEEFNKDWSEIDRREKRVGGWRDFQGVPDAKKMKAASFKEESRLEKKHGVVKTETWKKKWK